MLELDHVLAAVRDLDRARRVFEERYGLASVEGGHHLRWGTANRIVPLGDAYIELIAVVDEEVALDDPFGRRIAHAASDDGALVAWAVRTDDIDSVAARLGLTAERGSRARPDESVIRWRHAGVEVALADPSLPFFIEWEPGSVLPGRAAESPSGCIDHLGLSGEIERLDAWLGPHDLPIRVIEGTPAVTSLRVTTAVGAEFEIGG